MNWSISMNKQILFFSSLKRNKKDEAIQYFSAVDGTDYVTPIECTPYTESNAEHFKTEYGVKGISEIKQPG